jgi:hypothetical protein
MKRFLGPVAAGISAARHVVWYVSYHVSASQSRSPR